MSAEKEELTGAQMLETASIREEKKREQELATGAETVGFTGIQGRLKDLIARLAGKGITVVGADALVMQRPDGMTSADLASLTSSVEGAVREGEGKELMENMGEAIGNAVKISMGGQGEDVSEANFFSLRNGLEALGLVPEKDKGRDGGMSV